MFIKELNRICPICGSNRGKVLGTVKMALGKGVNLPTEYDITTCSICGFAFADTTSKQEDYNAYYKSDNCYSYEGEIKSEQKKQSIYCMTEFLSKHISKDDRILDIGCGSGDLLIALRNNGYKELTGLDPAEASVQCLIKEGIKGIKRNIFEICDSNGEKFDVIVSTCVLEHICDLNGFINIALSYLREGGKIFIVVPAVEGFEKYYQSKPNYFNHEHINYFSKNSLTNLMGSHGCESIHKNNGEFYVVEPRLGIKDLMLQNIFIYKDNLVYKQQIDTVSEKSISNFWRQCTDEDRRILDIINKLTLIDDKCIVWGAGSLSMQLMTCEEFAKHVAFFVDNNQEKWGEDISGSVIYEPAIIKEIEYSNLPIIVACMQNSDAIINQIQDMKVKNAVLVY